LYYAIYQPLDVKLATNIVDRCVGLASCCHCILMGDRLPIELTNYASIESYRIQQTTI